MAITGSFEITVALRSSSLRSAISQKISQSLKVALISPLINTSTSPDSIIYPFPSGISHCSMIISQAAKDFLSDLCMIS
jgi:hypothetical protein